MWPNLSHEADDNSLPFVGTDWMLGISDREIIDTGQNWPLDKPVNLIRLRCSWEDTLCQDCQ